jgi:hypothetical protein
MKGVPIYNVEYKRFLSEREAATYAGMTVNEFRRECSISSIARAQGRQVWDVYELDRWLDPIGVKQNVDEIIARL